MPGQRTIEEIEREAKLRAQKAQEDLEAIRAFTNNTPAPQPSVFERVKLLSDIILYLLMAGLMSMGIIFLGLASVALTLWMLGVRP